MNPSAGAGQLDHGEHCHMQPVQQGGGELVPGGREDWGQQWRPAQACPLHHRGPQQAGKVRVGVETFNPVFSK